MTEMRMLKLAALLLGLLAGACAEAEDVIGDALDVTMLPKCGTHLKDALFTRAYEADKRVDEEWAACADAEAVRARQRTIRSAILGSMGLPTGLPFGSARRLADIVIRNVRAKAMSPTASAITGTALCRPQNVTLENVEVECMSAGYAASGAAKDVAVPEKEGAYPDPWMFDHMILPVWGLYVRHVDGLTLRNVDFRLEPNDFTDNSRVELRKRIVRDDVKGNE